MSEPGLIKFLGLMKKGEWGEMLGDVFLIEILKMTEIN
jgi:hypothetical protein